MEIWAVNGGSASNDPHIAGPHGERFDFFGQAGGDYALFESRRFVVNAHLDTLARSEARFMTHIALQIGNATTTIVFDTVRHGDGFIEQLNKQLSLVDAKVFVCNLLLSLLKILSFSPKKKKASFVDDSSYVVRVEICDGQSLVVTQKYDVVKTKTNDDDESDVKQFYLDVELDIAGCHDDFDGIIGQMYQCK